MSSNPRQEKVVSKAADDIPTAERKPWVAPTVIVSSISRDTAKTSHFTFETHTGGSVSAS